MTTALDPSGGDAARKRAAQPSVGPAHPIRDLPGARGRPVVSVLSTGGTISSHTDPVVGRIPGASGWDLLSAVAHGPFCTVRAVEVFSRSSFALRPRDMGEILIAVREQLADTDVAGVVITHGTDTLEETAYLLQLFHRDARPVVITGAIRPADDPGADGPANLRDALIVAASPTARHRGVLIAFAGQVFAAQGTVKVDTTALAAFGSPGCGALGSVTEDGVIFAAVANESPYSDLSACSPHLTSTRVDIVALYPGADDTALRACAQAGAQALVLEGSGSGNAPPRLTAAVADLSATGVLIALSSRVPGGPIAPLYGGPGGGRELLMAGAIPTGWMRPSHARIALLALLACEPDRARVRQLFASLTAQSRGQVEPTGPPYTTDTALPT